MQNSVMPKFMFALGLAVVCQSSFAQIPIGSGTIDFTGFNGSGFNTKPAPGQLNSNHYSIIGASDGALPFGGTGTTGDFARGTTTGGTGSGGVYAFDDGGNIALGVQPTGGDLTPGNIIVRFRNTGGAAIDQLDVAYDIVTNNDQARANSFNFSFGFALDVDGDCDGFTAVPALDFTSPEASDALGFQRTPRLTTLTGLAAQLTSGADIFICFSTNDVSGGGSRDEIGFDNLLVSPPGGADLPPRIISSDPADGVAGVAGNATITLNFSEPVDLTANAAALVCSGAPQTLTGLPLNNVMSAVLTPTAALPMGSCTLTASAAEITDLDAPADQLDGNSDGVAGDDFQLSFFVGFPQFEIFEVQGSGAVSPIAGQTVEMQNNIVTAVGPDGFAMQTPDARDDGDPDTSNGVYVFTDTAPNVAVGDDVTVIGEVVEFFELTEITNKPQVTVNSSGNPLPAAVIFDSSTPSTDPDMPSCAIEFECYEGMRVSIPEGVVSQSNLSFGVDPIAEVAVVAGPQRAFRGIGALASAMLGGTIPVWDGNPELFELDPDRLGLPNQLVAGGSRFTAEGVIGFEFGDYELWPSSLVITPAPLPRPVQLPQPFQSTVGSANLLRLFNDVNDPGPEDDDATATTEEFQLRLGKVSQQIRLVMGAPDVIAVQEVENQATLQSLADQINADDASLSYTATLIEGNDVGGIDSGYLVRTGLNIVMVEQLGAAEVLSVDGSLLHDRPPLRMKLELMLDGTPTPINLLALHTRSLSGIEQSRTQTKRLEQANSIAVMIQNIQTSDLGVPIVVLGDMNAFQFTDGYVDVVGQIAGTAVQEDNLMWTPPLLSASPLTVAVDTLPADEQYSFIFQGNAQVLDQALLDDNALMIWSGMAFGRNNTDASTSLEDDGETVLRASDHDSFVLYFSADPEFLFGNGFEN